MVAGGWARLGGSWSAIFAFSWMALCAVRPGASPVRGWGNFSDREWGISLIVNGAVRTGLRVDATRGLDAEHHHLPEEGDVIVADHVHTQHHIIV